MSPIGRPMVVILLAAALSAPVVYCETKPSLDSQSQARKYEILKKAHKLRTSDYAAFVAMLQSAAELLPSVPVGTIYGQCALVRFRMNAQGQRLDAVKFRAPAGSACDMVWCFNMRSAVTWYIAPAKGKAGDGFVDYQCSESQVPGPSGTPSKLTKYLQHLDAQRLTPGEEYILWFNMVADAPEDVELAVNCLPAGQVEDTLPALAEALGREREFQPAPAAHSGTDSKPWWEEKYEEAGRHDPRWDGFVVDGIRHWKGNNDRQAASFLFYKALRSGCTCPIVEFLYALMLFRTNPNSDLVRRHLSEAESACGDQPQLKTVKFNCLDIIAWTFLDEQRPEEALRIHERALAMGSENVDYSIWLDGEEGFRQAKSLMELDSLKPPVAQDRESVRAYLRGLSELFRARGSSPDANILSQRLAAIDRSSLDLLLMNLSDEQIGAACRQRIQKIATEADKATIVKWLDADHMLIDVVQNRGWERDAKAVLLKGLAEHPQWLPNGWAYSVAMLRDPNSYEDLKWYFLHGAYPGLTYYAINEIPLQLDSDMIRKAWEGDRDKTDFHAWLVVAFLDYGMLEGLDYAVEHLSHPWTVRPSPRELMLTYTDARGTDDQLRAWFQQNRDHLKFDKATRKFHVQTAK